MCATTLRTLNLLCRFLGKNTHTENKTDISNQSEDIERIMGGGAHVRIPGARFARFIGYMENKIKQKMENQHRHTHIEKEATFRIV